jgi:2-oxoglutarate/2-oxoacid ferredoxin oxidoreductase subunit beta
MSCTANCSINAPRRSIDQSEYHSENLYTWCTGCGNYGIHGALRRALAAEHIPPHNVLMCFDIGCNGNGSDKIDGYRLHGLHGRVIPIAAGAALSNRRVKVIAMAGDGATLSEGVNHFIHAIRCNYPFLFVIHNNANYALTTGQASATTPQGVPMNASPDGLTGATLNIMQLVLSLNPSFAARGYSGNVKQLTQLFRAGLNHTGFGVLEILQSCPTYNKAMTPAWYAERIYDVTQESNYDPSNLAKALTVSRDLSERIATGVLFTNPEQPNFYKQLANRREYNTELVDEVQTRDISELLSEFR